MPIYDDWCETGEQVEGRKRPDGDRAGRWPRRNLGPNLGSPRLIVLVCDWLGYALGAVVCVSSW
ncbi:hypothetical protein FHS99_003496 [Sphingomonas prati]|uniref:Uncharacterized protein n=1 Tax=Sphingomonas prati TaxID=1843237 RepID=A0A7W9BWK1_9SPHN|nr:hypothetical protein [Sphingomonas prati]